MISGRAVRVYPMRVLLDVVPVVLVEHGPLPGPRRADAGLQVDHRLPRPAAGGQARQAQGPLLSLQASVSTSHGETLVRNSLFSQIQA